ncbi:hypothetical protein MBLNU459_g3164t1 [Dothideomycetes sp. NU459]
MDPRLAGRAPRHPSAAPAPPSAPTPAPAPAPAPAPRPSIQLTLAKGGLVGRLTTSDPHAPKLLAPQINQFHASLEKSLRDDPQNSEEFKECVAWIVCHVAQSRSRTAALGDYLVKLSESLDYGQSEDTAMSNVHDGVYDDARARVNLLRLLGAVLLFVHDNPNDFLSNPSATSLIFSSQIARSAVRLADLAAPRQGVAALPLHRELSCLFRDWKANCLFTPSTRVKLREAARAGYYEWLTWARETHPTLYHRLNRSTLGDTSYTCVPAFHGRDDDAWFDLPVGAVIPLIKNRRPIKHSRIRPFQTPPGPVDPEMLSAVYDLLDECKKIYAAPNVAPYKQDEEVRLDGLGQRIIFDSVSGKRKHEDTYYSQREKFARTMKKIRKEALGPQRPDNVTAQIVPPLVQQGAQQRFAPPPFQPGGLPPPPPPPPVGGMPFPPPFYNGPSSNRGGGSSGGWRGADRGRSGGNYGSNYGAAAAGSGGGGGRGGSFSGGRGYSPGGQGRGRGGGRRY